MMKLLMSWDIRPGKEAAYFDFVVREFTPGMMKLGLQPTEAWYTIFGDSPQIVTGGVASDMETVQNILESEEWRLLKEKLLSFVVNYSQKVIPATGRFQL
ncbi:MAG: hypothetical protein ACUVV0_16755 [Anaerolineae bacterium]